MSRTPLASVTVTIPRRFRGPEQSANGGYCAGLVAAAVQAEPDAVVEVTLRAPPPLDTPLQLQGDAREATLAVNGQTLANARRVSMPEMALPVSCGLVAAERAAGHFVGHAHHPYPGCFVCGPQRKPGDGLRIFAGRAEPPPYYAAPWVPDASLVATDGLIDRRMIWAALDCPSYFALGKPALPALLGRMTAQVSQLPAVGEPCVLIAWATSSEGRKHHAATALYGEDGRLLAHAATIWIELKEPIQ